MRRKPNTSICSIAGALALAVVVALTCAGCASRPGTPRPTPTPTSSPVPSSTPAPSVAATLTPEQLAGQRIIYGYAGLTPPDRLVDLIRHGEAAGVIFFGDNISSEKQLRHVIALLQAANAAPTNPVRAPLLMMIDQEGGKIRRLSGPPKLSQKQIGEAENPSAEARKAGRETGAFLNGLGLNVNLAPVLDVYRRKGDFSDKYERSYDRDPLVVSALGGGFIKDMQEQGVAATAKHYPGLGTATAGANTDARSVTLPLSENTISNVDEAPFRTAIASGVKIVMVSWAIYPALDASTPAGMSAAIVERRLRRQLGFRGVIVSDSIQADALKPFGGMGPRARLTADAGVDLIICGKGTHGISAGVQAKDALATWYRTKSTDDESFRASVSRVIALRKSLGD